MDSRPVVILLTRRPVVSRVRHVARLTAYAPFKLLATSVSCVHTRISVPLFSMADTVSSAILISCPSGGLKTRNRYQSDV